MLVIWWDQFAIYCIAVFVYFFTYQSLCAMVHFHRKVRIEYEAKPDSVVMTKIAGISTEYIYIYIYMYILYETV